MTIKDKKILMGLFLGALIIRLVYLLDMSGGPYFGAPYLDELYHLNWAADIAAGDMMREGGFFRAPLYSYLLGGFVRLFGINYYLIRLAQHFYGALAVCAIYLLTLRMFGRREAVIAGIFAACYAPFFFFEGEMLDIFLQFLLYPLILILAFNAMKTPSVRKCILLGIVIGISATARPNILIFAPALLIFFITYWAMKRDAPIDAVSRSALIIIAVILPILPVTIHNLKAGAGFVPIGSYGGVNFYIGNNQNADGHTARTARRMYYFGRYRDSVEMFAKDEATRIIGEDATSAEISSYWFGRTLDWIVKNPGSWLKLMLKKGAMFFGNYEIKNNKNIYYVTRFSGILRFFLSVFPFALVGSLGVIGMFLSLFRRRTPKTLLSIVFFAVYFFGVILFFVSARYRAPAMAVMIPFSAFTVTSLWDASGTGDRKTLIGGSLALAVLVVLSFVDWCNVKPETYARDHWSVGNCWLEKGEEERAERFYRLALHFKPDYEDALNNLGEVQFKQKEYSDAANTFKKLVEQHPGYARGWNNLGVCYETLEMYQPANAIYAKALDINPDFILARVNLVETLMKIGRIDEAKEQYRLAIESAPPSFRKTLENDERFSELRP